MPTAADIDYYQRRECQERAFAERAVSPAGRDAHLEMARRYARLIAEAPERTRPTLRMSMRR